MTYIALVFSVLFISSFSRNRSLKKSCETLVEENRRQIIFQDMASELSEEFAEINHDNMEVKMDLFLERLGSFIETDRAFLFSIDEDKRTMSYEYEWCAEGVEGASYRTESLDMDEFHWLMDQFNMFIGTRN